MLGIYFSGTGNSRYALEHFLGKYDKSAKVFAIEAENIVSHIKDNDEIVFSYSVQYSNIPKMLKDFVDKHQRLWRGKKVFVIATMGLFSGDGAGILARRLHKYGAQITGGLHLKMPDSIADEKALKRPLGKNKELVKAAEEKINNAVRNVKNGKPPQEGLGFLYHFAKAGNQCTMCYRCINICPKQAVTLLGKSVVEQGTIEKYL